MERQEVKKGPQAITGAVSIVQAQRRAEILRLRLDGLTLEEIGERMNIAPDTVHGIITRALSAMCKEPAEELRALELGRCDVLLNEAMQTVRAFHPMVSGGRVVSAPVLDNNGQPVRNEAGDVLTRVLEDKAPKLAAIATSIRVMERRAKLLGLDAPVRQDVTVTASSSEDFSHLTVDDMEEIKARLYGGQRVLTHNQTESKEVH
jgi:predicted DNA-binding protein (UPF0251 family)